MMGNSIPSEITEVILMKLSAALCAAVLCAALFLSCMPVHGEAEIYENMIRLHVIAESDSPSDQARKLRVRDAVLDCLSEELSEAHGYEDALEAVETLLPEIRRAAEDASDGVCSVSVCLGEETYPVRCYENFTLPAGKYTSLRVILGSGEGKNWWCVLFPQLCTAQASRDDFYEDFIAAGFSPEQYRLIRNESGVKYKIRFRILELLSEWAGFDF